MRVLAVAILLLVSCLFAESQESAYYKALKAEENGDVSESIKWFETALEIDGPYTEEIKEILDEYYEALGMDKSALGFRLSADLSFIGIRYDGENRGEAVLSLASFLDYTSGSWIHSLGLVYSGNVFLGDTLSVLDTVSWNVSPGLEYDLIAPSFILSAGLNFNINPEDWNPAYFVWLEKDWLRFGKQKVGTAVSFFNENKGILTATLFASLHRYAPYGFNMHLFLGPRLESDDVFDYERYLEDYTTLREYNVKWLGPQLRGKMAYKFRYNIKTELTANVFYGLVVDGPSAEYEKMGKLSGSWGPTISWTPNVLSLYLGGEQVFKRYINMPPAYQDVYDKGIYLWKLKAGIQLDW